MNKIHFPISVLLLLVIGLTGCTRGGPADVTHVPDLAFTQAAETIIAELTLAVPPATDTPLPLPPTDTPTQPPPTDTPVIISTPVPETATPLPSVTPAVGTLPVTPIDVTATPGGETSAPVTLTPAAVTLTPVPGFRVVYEDDFSGQAFWDVQRMDQWGFRYNQGGYVIYVNIGYATIWSVKSQAYDDVSMEVDASRLSGPGNGYYGLVCRHVDGSNYYALVVSPNGNYGILKHKNGQNQWLLESPAPTETILGGDSVNRVRVDCIGNTLSLFVNGQKLAEVQDADFTSGAVGMAAGTRNQTRFEALFDNLVVRTP